MEVLIVVNPDSLPEEYKRKSPRAVNIIKLKRIAKLKVRICANRAPYHKFEPREKIEFLMITLEGILATMVIGAY